MDGSSAKNSGRSHKAVALSLAIAVAPVALAGRAVAEDWTGFYAGGQIGWMDIEYPTTLPIPGGILYDGSGTPLGVHAGYNHDFGTLVLGAEVSVDFPSIDLESTVSGTPNVKGVDRFAAIKAKIGYDAGRFLPHAIVGYASQKFDNRGSPSTPTLTFEGMTYGVGVSYLANENMTVGVEALWFDLDPTDPVSTLSSEGTQVSLRLSYRF